MSGIGNFLSKGAKPDRVKQFELVSVGKSKEEIRELEMMLLQPEENIEYTGEVYRYEANSEYTVKMVLPSKEDWELFTKYFTVCNYIEKNISNINLLLDMLRSIESGNLIYDKKKRIFSTAAVDAVSNEIPLVEEKKKRKCVSKKSSGASVVTEELAITSSVECEKVNQLQGERKDVRSFFGRS